MGYYDDDDELITTGGVVGFLSGCGAGYGFSSIYPSEPSAEEVHTDQMLEKLEHLSSLVSSEALATQNPTIVSARLDQALDYIQLNDEYFATEGLSGLEQGISAIKSNVEYFVTDWPGNANDYHAYLGGGSHQKDLEFEVSGRMGGAFREGWIASSPVTQYNVNGDIQSINQTIAEQHQEYRLQKLDFKNGEVFDDMIGSVLGLIGGAIVFAAVSQFTDAMIDRVKY